MDMKLGPAASDVLPGRSHVVLHIATAEYAARVHVFEAGEHFFGSAFRDMHDHVQSPAMAHPHYQLDGSILASAFEDFIHEWYQRGDAFQ